MGRPEKAKIRLRFAHVLIGAAFLITLAHFAILGFAPYLMALIPSFPFLLLVLFPVSWNFVSHEQKHGLIGAGIGAFAATLPVTVLLAYDVFTGWRGGADIGLGLLYMFLPLYSVVFITLGYITGEIVGLVCHRDLGRLPGAIRMVASLTGIGFCLYFLVKSYSSYDLLRYYRIHDPSVAELYEIDFWLYISFSGAALLIPLAVSLVTRKRGKTVIPDALTR